MRRTLIWLISTQLMTGSSPVHFEVRVYVHVELEVKQKQTAETPPKQSQPQSLKAK
jgi:hypothetical protein